MTYPVVTEFKFVRVHAVGEMWDDNALYILGGVNENGHILKVFTRDGNAKQEAIRQLKGMLKCLEDLT